MNNVICSDWDSYKMNGLNAVYWGLNINVIINCYYCQVYKLYALLNLSMLSFIMIFILLKLKVYLIHFIFEKPLLICTDFRDQAR